MAPPNAMSTATRRPPSSDSSRPRASTYAGTFRKVTPDSDPRSRRTRASTRPDGTSIARGVSPSAIASTRPDSTSQAPSAIVPCPQAVEKPSLCQKSEPIAAASSSGGTRKQPYMPARLVTEELPHGVDLGVRAGALAPLPDRGPRDVGRPSDDDAKGLAGGVVIDRAELHAPHSLSRRQAAQRHLDGRLEARADRSRGRLLLAADPLGQPGCLLVSGPLGHEPQLRIRGDLEVLEREREAGELGGCVTRLRAHEAAEVEAADPEHRVLEARRSRPARLEARAHGGLLRARLLEVLLERLAQLRLRGEDGGGLEQLKRLGLDRVRVLQIAVELGAQIVGIHLAQRGVHRALEPVRQPLGHRRLLLADRAGHLGGVDVAGALRDVHEQVVRRQLHVLVGVCVRHELAGRVRLGARERDHSDAARARHQVLHERAVCRARVQPGAHAALLLACLLEVLAERARELRVARHARCDDQLLERLLLDRMDVGQMLYELLGDGVGHAARLPGRAAGYPDTGADASTASSSPSAAIRTRPAPPPAASQRSTAAAWKSSRNASVWRGSWWNRA